MRVELEASEVLLDVGVSVPFRVRLPFTRRKFTLFRVTLKRPYLGGLVRIARLYLQTGVTFEELENYNKDQELLYLARHGDKLAGMIALMICRREKAVFAPLVKWFVKWFVPPDIQFAVNLKFISLLGVAPFTNIIKSTGRINPLRPNLSQRKKGS